MPQSVRKGLLLFVLPFASPFTNTVGSLSHDAKDIFNFYNEDRVFAG